MTQEATDIVRIGAGSFATVYTWQGRNNVAIKCVADPSRCAELLREYEAHRAVHGAAGDNIFQVPAAGSHYPSYSKFKQDLGLEADPMGNTVCMYTMERVWPIPHVMSAKIKNLYFPEEHKRYPKHFIARVYLGRDPERSKQLYVSRFFNANNFPLDAERCEQLQLPVRMLAQGMGRLLARIHYWTGMDGRDIEFVLGGHWKQTLTEHAFFCFDFNQMKPHGDSVKRLVDSFFSNDPYYPRPGGSYWADFRNSYTYEASQAPAANKATQLAVEFIDQIEAALVAKSLPQAPEGRGNEMSEFDDV